MNIIKNIIRFSNSSRPRHAVIALTHRCNAKCVICNFWERPSSVSDELSIDQWRKCIKKLFDYGVNGFFISGGEPLLYSEIRQLSKFISDLGAFQVFCTNAILLDQKVLDWMSKINGLRLNISLDSLVPLRYERIRGVDLLPLIIENIIAASKNRSFFAKLHMTVNSLNYREVYDMINFCKRFDLRFAACSYHSSENGTLYNYDKELSVEENRQEIIDVFRKLALDSRVSRTLFGYSKYYEFVADVLSGKKVDYCGAGTTFLFVNYNGELGGCSEIPLLGSLLENDPDEMLDMKKISFQQKACLAGLECTASCSYLPLIAKEHIFDFALESIKSGRILDLVQQF